MYSKLDKLYHHGFTIHTPGKSLGHVVDKYSKRFSLKDKYADIEHNEIKY